MRARDVVGRRIVAVKHARFWNAHLCRMETVVDWIKLDDGSILAPWATEGIDGPIATIQQSKLTLPKKGGRP